ARRALEEPAMRPHLAAAALPPRHEQRQDLAQEPRMTAESRQERKLLARESMRAHHHNTAQRYTVWRLQAQVGQEPCFGTDARYRGGDRGPAYRADCLALRASWRR